MAIENTGGTLTKANGVSEQKESIDNSIKDIRAVVYARTPKIDENESFLYQVNICCDFIKQKGWTLCDIFFDECTDRRGIDRPELSNMFNNASKGCFDVVVVSSKDRLSRFEENTSIIEKILADLKIQVVLVTDTGHR